MWSSTKESIARSISRMALKFPPFTVGWSIQNTRSPRTDLTAICAPASFLPSQISPSVYSGAMRLISSRHTHTASRVMNCAEANPRWFNCAARVSARSATDLLVLVVLTLLGSARLVMVPLALALRRFFLFPGGVALALNGVFVRCGSSVRRSSSPGSVAGVSSRGSSFASPSSSSSGSDPSPSSSPSSRTPSILRYSARGPSASSSPPATPTPASSPPRTTGWAANRTRSVDRFLLHLTRAISSWSQPSGNGTSATYDVTPSPVLARTHSDRPDGSVRVTISATMSVAPVTPGRDTSASKYPPPGDAEFNALASS